MATLIACSNLVRGLALAAAGLAGGCGVFSQAPRIEVESLSLVRTDDARAEADLVVRISGGGPQATILTDFRYSVFVSGRRAYTGRWAALAAAPPEEFIRRSLPVVIPVEMLDGPDGGEGLVETPWSVSGSVGWEDPDRFARILLDLGFATPRAEFSGRGGSITSATSTASPVGSKGDAGAAAGEPESDGFEAIDPPPAP